MEAKSIFLSKTFLVNALTAAAAVLTYLSGATELIPASALPYVVGALSIVNIGLRLITDKSVTVP
jgi:hypothetical protein